MGEEVKFQNVLMVVPKTIPANGQISGFKEYAGRTVKVVIFDEAPAAPDPAPKKKGA